MTIKITGFLFPLCLFVIVLRNSRVYVIQYGTGQIRPDQTWRASRLLLRGGVGLAEGITAT